VEGIRFEWDEAKNLSNQRKHGVSFEQASAVFLDSLYVSVQDRIEDGEFRWQTVGMVEDLLLLTVAHTVREEDEGTSIDIFRIISARVATRKEGDAMKTKTTSYTPETLPTLTKADRGKLKALAARSDSEIDTGDIPEMTDEQWKHARRGHFYRPRKRQITARVDADVLDWLKSRGKGYHSRINAILRREMLTSGKAGK
jgi:uncharacterized DUF497 family protein